MLEVALTVGQIVVRVCLFIVAAIAISGGVLLAGIGRLVSMSKVGLPKPAGVWLGYLVPELLIPFVMAGAHYAGR